MLHLYDLTREPNSKEKVFKPIQDYQTNSSCT